MSHFTPKSELKETEIWKGFHGRFVHTGKNTIGYIRIEKGAQLPEHHHHQTQITTIISGEFEMTVNGETKLCKAGDVVEIPRNAPHSAVALTECYAIDVFEPERDDYKF